MTAAWRRMRTWTRRRARAVFAAAALAVAVNAPAVAGQPDDPLEPLNRAVLKLNLLAFDWALAPAASLSRATTPEPVRRSLGNVLENLRAPGVFANDVLQGEPARAGTILGRFAINSTVGVFGLLDPASDLGYLPHQEDLGQTLGTYGVPAGPYLMLPLLGPSNVRDTVARVADHLMLNLYLFDTDAMDAAATLHETETGMDRLRALRADSLDFYAVLRSAHEQSRATEIANGRPAGPDDEYEAIFAEQ